MIYSSFGTLPTGGSNLKKRYLVFIEDLAAWVKRHKVEKQVMVVDLDDI